jgi:hypothetical protein
MSTGTPLTIEQKEELLSALNARFEANLSRHAGLSWADVLVRLEAHPQNLLSLNEMERTGGEPDVIGRDESTGEVIFVDCAPESPTGRRALCYDQAALEARRKNKPAGSAIGMAAEMGVALMTEAEYRALQQLGEFDLKTSSWVLTPPKIRDLGGALFCDRRFDTVFVYHNGADSYYSARGFRAVLKI